MRHLLPHCKMLLKSNTIKARIQYFARNCNNLWPEGVILTVSLNVSSLAGGSVRAVLKGDGDEKIQIRGGRCRGGGRYSFCSGSCRQARSGTGPARGDRAKQRKLGQGECRTQGAAKSRGIDKRRGPGRNSVCPLRPCGRRPRDRRCTGTGEDLCI